MKASDLFVRALETEGVRYVFGIPGEENLDLLESLRTSSIQLVLTRHEQAAAFMAATWGRLTGEPGVCLSTLGPGATNLVTGAAYAQLGGMPMVMITGQKPIKTSKQGRFQILDVVATMRPLTKSARQIVHANNIPSAVREAFRLAREERPGAVHLELPEDVAAESTDARLFSRSDPVPPDPATVAVEAACAVIERATRPLALIGAGANRDGQTRDAVLAFLDETGIPFFSTQMGKGVVDERHPRCLGTAALTSGDYLHCAIDRADLIVNIGHDVVEKPPFLMGPEGPTVVHVNRYTAQVDDVYFPQIEVIGCISTALREMASSIRPAQGWDFDYYLRTIEAAREHVHDRDDDGGFPLIPQRIVSDVRSAMPDDGVIALDNGMYKIWFARNYPACQPNTVLLDNALATMGAGLPSAMGARFVHPDRKVLAIVGDGGFMMNSQELETAVRLELDLVVLILRDDAYGMIRWKQAGLGLTDWGLTYGNPDFVRYAEAYGAQGYRVTGPDQLRPLLEDCLSRPGVQLLEVPIDYSENERVLIDELAAKVCLI